MERLPEYHILHLFRNSVRNQRYPDGGVCLIQEGPFRTECDNQAFCIHHVLFGRTDSHLYGGQQPSYGEYENCPGGDGDGYRL